MKLDSACNPLTTQLLVHSCPPAKTDHVTPQSGHFLPVGFPLFAGGVFAKTLANNQISTRKGPFFACFRVSVNTSPRRVTVTQAHFCDTTRTPCKADSVFQWICSPVTGNGERGWLRHLLRLKHNYYTRISCACKPQSTRSLQIDKPKRKQRSYRRRGAHVCIHIFDLSRSKFIGECCGHPGLTSCASARRWLKLGQLSGLVGLPDVVQF